MVAAEPGQDEIYFAKLNWITLPTNSIKNERPEMAAFFMSWGHL